MRYYRQWHSEDLDATQHSRRRSLVPTAHVLSRNTVGYHMLVYIYIHIFINYYLLEHRSTFDNCIVKVDYGIFNIQPSNQLSNIAFYTKRLMLSAGRRRSGFEATRINFTSALCVSSGLFFTLSLIETYIIDNVLSVKSTITLHSTAHSNHTSYKNLLHAPMFTLLKCHYKCFIVILWPICHLRMAWAKILYLIKFSSVQYISKNHISSDFLSPIWADLY